MIKEVPDELKADFDNMLKLIYSSKLIKYILSEIQCKENPYEAPVYIQFIKDFLRGKTDLHYGNIIATHINSIIANTGFSFEHINDNIIILSYQKLFLVHIWYRHNYDHNNDIRFHLKYNKSHFSGLTDLYYYDESIRVTKYYKLALDAIEEVYFFQAEAALVLDEEGLNLADLDTDNIWIDLDTNKYVLLCMGNADSEYNLYCKLHWVVMDQANSEYSKTFKLRVERVYCQAYCTYFRTNDHNPVTRIDLRPMTSELELANALLTRIFHKYLMSKKKIPSYVDFIIEAENCLSELYKESGSIYYITQPGKLFNTSEDISLQVYQLHLYSPSQGDEIIAEIYTQDTKNNLDEMLFALNLIFTSIESNLLKDQVVALFQQGLSLYTNIVPKYLTGKEFRYCKNA